MRYFFISYFYKTKDGFGFGHTCYESELFPSANEIEASVNRSNNDCEGIAIISVRELNEDDYKSFLDKE